MEERTHFKNKVKRQMIYRLREERLRQGKPIRIVAKYTGVSFENLDEAETGIRYLTWRQITSILQYFNKKFEFRLVDDENLINPSS